MISIRKLDAGDYRALVDLWEKAGLPFRPRGRDSEENIRKQLKSGHVTILGAYEGEKLSGVVMLTHDGRKGWINRLAVLPEMRNRGIATRLVDESERFFKKLGFEVFGVLIESDRAESKRLFEKLGYVRESEIEYFTKRLRKDA
ncbi:MAG: GNAT family N-acetyltransferase [Thermoplasmata archaeon]